MPRIHVVQQGETLTSIAKRYGFASARALYDAPANRELRKSRPSPEVLEPGDRVVLPEPQLRAVSGATGSSVAAIVAHPPWALRVKLVAADGKALAGKAYELRVGGTSRKGEAAADGLVEEVVDPAEDEVVLVVDGLERVIRIGHLNPVAGTSDQGLSGVQARLKNLGFDVGKVDGLLGARTRAGIAAFRRGRGLGTGTGIDQELLDALVKAHGC